MDPENEFDDYRPEAETPSNTGVRSLRELIDLVSGKPTLSNLPQEESGLAEILPFPFLAIMGQEEMKLGLLLSIINPMVGGVLLVGPRGTGKTTAARSLLDLLPEVERSTCYYGCLPKDIETGGIDAVCPDCAKKYLEGTFATKKDTVRLVELPLNATLEDVIGGLDERALMHDRTRLKRGILTQADQNILYVDEVNLLNDSIVDAILDASAQGIYTVRRGPISSTYWARFILIGSMNPEEGALRPQIMDRFGLRILVRGLPEAEDRIKAYQRVIAYRNSPRALITQYGAETILARTELQQAHELLPKVTLTPKAAKYGAKLISKLGIDSLRAEVTLFEAARAFAASDARTEVTPDDIKVVASISLRMRRSKYMNDYFQNQSVEDSEFTEIMGGEKI